LRLTAPGVIRDPHRRWGRATEKKDERRERKTRR
jgi:hypothetical protein